MNKTLRLSIEIVLLEMWEMLFNFLIGVNKLTQF